MTTINSIAASNVGNVRENNEDNFFLNGRTLSTPAGDNEIIIKSNEINSGLFAVCDGMGGEEHGDTAAAIAVSVLQGHDQKVFEVETSFDEFVAQYVDDANTQICNEIEKNGGKRMGTTFAMLYVFNQTAYISNIGDSRVYLFRENKLAQLSKDHTQIKRLLDMGILSEEGAKTHPDRHKLTQHLGIFPEEMIIEPFIAESISLNTDDVFLLCSDGLTDMIDDADIEVILSQNSCPEEAARKLIDVALQNGGIDNVTVVLVKISDSSEREKEAKLKKRKGIFSLFK